jgi:hypothetical protein
MKKEPSTSSLYEKTTQYMTQRQDAIASQLQQMPQQDQIQRYMDYVISQHDLGQQRQQASPSKQEQIMPSQPPIWQLAPYYYPEQAAKDSPQKVIDPQSPLK